VFLVVLNTRCVDRLSYLVDRFFGSLLSCGCRLTLEIYIFCSSLVLALFILALDVVHSTRFA
jgi:hypothetical protein